MEPTIFKSYGLDQVMLHAHWQQSMALARNQDDKRLLKYGYKVFSQNDEDGIIQEILRRIDVESRVFVEFGVGNGSECNSLWLLMLGWKGLWIEAQANNFKQITQTHSALIERGNLSVINEFTTIGNIDQTINANLDSPEIDLLSIDIDFNDYWVWEAITSIQPRIVVVEYNATWRPPLSVTVPYTDDAVWNGTNYFGASLTALAKLGQSKGYRLVGCCFAGVNAFFVRSDLCKDDFLKPGDAVEHYEPARYFMSAMSSGHPPGIGPLVEI